MYLRRRMVTWFYLIVTLYFGHTLQGLWTPGVWWLHEFIFDLIIWTSVVRWLQSYLHLFSILFPYVHMWEVKFKTFNISIYIFWDSRIFPKNARTYGHTDIHRLYLVIPCAKDQQSVECTCSTLHSGVLKTFASHFWSLWCSLQFCSYLKTFRLSFYKIYHKLTFLVPSAFFQIRETLVTCSLHVEHTLKNEWQFTFERPPLHCG